MIHLNIRGYEPLTSDTEVLRPSGAPTVWAYTEERLPDPKAADPKQATLKESACASLPGAGSKKLSHRDLQFS